MVTPEELKQFGNLPDLDNDFLEVHINAAQREIERLLGARECPEERKKEAVMCMAMSFVIPAVGVGYLKNISAFPQDMMDGAEFEKYGAEEIQKLASMWRRRAKMCIAPCINSPVRIAG